MKRFFAGALAAALVLSNSAPAFADKTDIIKEQGDVRYNLSADNPDIVLNIVLPGDINIAMNPYGNRFFVIEDSDASTNNGIVSVAYPILNYETDYGVFLDAKAVTTTSSSKWVVSREPVEPGVKGANMSFTASDTPEGITQYSSEFKKAASATSQGNMPLDSTIPYNKKTGTPKGQTEQKKIAYIPASVDGETPGTVYVGFTGMLAGDSDTMPVRWKNGEDEINVKLVLKFTPASKYYGS